MNSFFEKNIEALKKYHNETSVNEEIVKEIGQKDNVEEIDSYNGYMLRSRVDQSKAVSVWCEQFEEIKYNDIVIVFGIGTLDYLVEFTRLYPDNVIVSYEPCEEVFYNCLATSDYTNFLKKSNCLFCVGGNRYLDFKVLSHNLVGYESFNEAYYALIPNYHKMFEEEYDRFKSTVKSMLESNYISRNTIITYEDQRIKNYLDNLTKISESSSVYEMLSEFKKHDISEYPAIILSAGPSLDKNIAQLKDINGRAFVIAVDAAVNTATKNDIKMDLVVTVDSFVYEDFLKDEGGREAPLLIHMYGSKPFRDLNRGRKIYVSDMDSYIQGLLKEYNKNISPLGTGGSVSNTAFSFAKEMGFKNIILIGQDLGYPGGKQHAEDTYEDEDDMLEDDPGTFFVESIDGGRVLTTKDMDVYRIWFEEAIRMYTDVNVIDATEGGALIHGTEILSLRDAIDKYCPNESMDFRGIINAADYLLTEEQRIEVNSEIERTFEDIDSNIEYLEKAKRDYYKLRGINEKRKYNTKEFKRAIDKVGEHNKFFDDCKDFFLYKKCCTKAYFQCIDAIKNVYDDEYKDIKNLVDQSLIMLDEYIKAGKKLKEVWSDTKQET